MSDNHITKILVQWIDNHLDVLKQIEDKNGPSCTVSSARDTFEKCKDAIIETLEGTVTVKADLVRTWHSFGEWLRSSPVDLPNESRRPGENFLFVDKNGSVFESGKDFEYAKRNNSYPCRVYRMINVSNISNQL